MEEKQFCDLGLDERLARAATKKGWKHPTPVQVQGIPEALRGKDLVIQAPTGSGKTAAYVLPILDRLFQCSHQEESSGWGALIVVPTRELSEQVREEISEFLALCNSTLEVTCIGAAINESLQNTLFANMGDIIISTPSQVRAILEKKVIPGQALFSNLKTLVLDEADLLLSYGYEKDLESFVIHLPQSCQCLMFCATLVNNMESLNRIVSRNPTTILVSKSSGREDGTGSSSLPDTIKHFKVHCKASEKLLNTICLLKFGLVQKKVLIFVNTIDSGYKVRLFLEHFGIKCAVLNAELPLNSRHNIIKHFNKGNFDYLIATDIDKVKRANQSEANEGSSEPKIDSDFGVVRGIDFKDVGTVINWDMPKTIQGYIHRVGRTGRAGQRGLCISLATEGDSEMLVKLKGEMQENEEQSIDEIIKPFTNLTKSIVDSLRYRSEDVSRAVSRSAIHEARAKELRIEILNSSKLKSHFQANPKDEVVLKHDRALSSRMPTHLKHIPKYLKDPSALLRKRNKGKQSKKRAGKRKTKASIDILKEAVTSK